MKQIYQHQTDLRRSAGERKGPPRCSTSPEEYEGGWEEAKKIGGQILSTSGTPGLRLIREEGRGEEPEAAHEELPPLRGRTGLPLPPCLLHAVAPQRYGSRREKDAYLRSHSMPTQIGSLLCLFR